MTINKVPTTQKEEEPVFSVFQKLFFRRSDITPDIRLYLAICSLGPQYRNCKIWELEQKYNICYTFIYEQGSILKNSCPVLFGAKTVEQDDNLAEVLSSARFFLGCKLETKGALEGLSNFANQRGIKYFSTSFISQLIDVAGRLVGASHSSIESPLILTFLCDEVYSGGQAILVTIDAQSMFVLDIKLVSGSLTSKDWEERIEGLQHNQVLAKVLIKDQGKQMASAVKVLSNQTIIGADTFHAIPHRLGIYHCRLKKEVEKAELKVAGRAIGFAKAKSYETALKREKEWEAAKIELLQAIDCLEWFDEYYFKLIQQLRPFTSKGLPRNKEKAEMIMKQSLEALTLLAFPNLEKELNHIEGLLANGQLLHFLNQVPTIHQNLQQVIRQETSWLWMLYWQWDKKSYQTHSPKVQQRAKSEALAAKELLTEYYQQLAGHKNLSQFEDIRKKVFSALNEIVQASSLVETFNSILKPFINSARGQVSQQLLNLVRFYHNHRVFKRGKRQNSAPIELLTGVDLDKSWLDLLMDMLKAAFEQQQVVSLKQLHQILCPKEEQNDKELIAQLPEDNLLKAA